MSANAKIYCVNLIFDASISIQDFAINQKNKLISSQESNPTRYISFGKKNSFRNQH